MTIKDHSLATVTAHLPGLDATAVALIAGACRDAAADAASHAQWDAVAELAADRIETAETLAARHIWDSVTELANDGRDYLAGRRFGAAGDAWRATVVPAEGAA